MAAIATVRTFTKGMVKDLDKSYVSKEQYLEANNFRLTTNAGESTGALENIDGNNIVYNGTPINPYEIMPNGMYICGNVNVRDTIVLFLTNNIGTSPSGGRSMIVRFSVNTATEKIGTVTTVYDDSLNDGTGTLDFSVNNPIKAVVAYESPTIQKVYWTDGYNNIRFCNIVDYLTSDGTIYTGTNTYMSPDKFDFLPVFSPSKATLTNIISGNLPTGKVQYSYQLYFLNGSTTSYAPVSNMIHLVKEDSLAGDSLDYKGENDITSSGKGVELSITVLDEGYNRLRLVRIHYSNYGSVPSIDVVSEIPISFAGGTYKIVDVGSSIANITIDEFNISSTEQFVCEDLEVKDKRLFAANIEKTDFTISNYDARAIRFRNFTEAPGAYTDTASKLLEYQAPQDADLAVEYINAFSFRTTVPNYSTFMNIPVDRTVTNVTAVSGSIFEIWYIAVPGGGPVVYTYPEEGSTVTIDQVNYVGDELTFRVTCSVSLFANPVFVEWDYVHLINTTYSYTTAGATSVRALVTDSNLGDVIVQDIIDPDRPGDWETAGWDDYDDDHDGVNEFNDTDNDGVDAKAYKFQSNGTVLGAEGPYIKIDFADALIDLDNIGDNTSHSVAPWSDNSYANPGFESKLSWQRDEVYRLFVTFFNNRGQSAAPQWICDLRMPSLHDDDFLNADGTTIHPDTLAAGAVDVTGYRLYPRIYIKSFPVGASYAQVSRVKRESQDRHIITQALVQPTSVVDVPVYRPADLQHNNVLTAGIQIIKLLSPEININKTITTSGSDYLDYLGDYATNESVHEDVRKRIYKFREFTKIATAANNLTDVSDTKFINATPTGSVSSITFGGLAYNNYSAILTCVDGAGNPESDNSGRGASGLMVSYANADWTAEGKNYCVVNYKCNRFGSQYGGNTYEARAYNVSIPCSDVILSSQTGVWKNIEYGDTYINYFDALTFYVDQEEVHSRGSICEVAYVPLESSINCNLLTGVNSPHKDLYEGGSVVSSSSFLIHEYAGIYAWDSERFDQESGIYEYNKVYSQEQSVQNIVSVPPDSPNETVFDCMVKVSGVKYNNETVDSWTKFAVNDYIEVDTQHGPIKAIKTISDKLLFWQEHGFGIFSVNERSIVQDQNSAAIVLGTGGILTRYDYISNATGVSDKFTVLVASSGVYWFYPKEKSVYRYGSNLENISKSKLMQSWFSENYPTRTYVRCVYDYKYNQVIYTFNTSLALGTGVTIAFDETIDSFSSLYSFASPMYVPFTGGYLSVNHYNPTGIAQVSDLLYLHNSVLGNKCYFYGAYYPSSVKTIFNEDYAYPKVFDNGFYSAEVTLSDVELQETSFNTVTCSNNYQNTSAITLTYGDNLRRREREWTYIIPRNVMNKLYNTNNDPSLVANQTTTRTFKERMRDKYMISELTFTNTSNRRMVVPYVGARYRISYR
jgi:hypothetical protein